MSEITLAQYDDWFHARLDGNYDKARWIRDQLHPFKGKQSTLQNVRKELIKRLEAWEKNYKRGTVLDNLRLEQSKAKATQTKERQPEPPPNLVRVAPAAIEIGSGSPFPRMGNTGGSYTDGEITSRISSYQIVEHALKLRKKDHLVKVDWLSVSFPTIELEDEQRLLWASISDLMERSGIAITSRGKGHHGYTDSASLSVLPVEGAKARNVGMLAWSQKQGYFMEISGLGCDYVYPHVEDLFTLITVYAGRLSRLDLALDLHSSYCLKAGLTVPKFAKAISDGVYRSIFTPKSASQTTRQEGDWGCIMFDGETVDSYDPTQHAPRGLTAYAGSVKSDNQVVFYEKGKQLLGAMPDKDFREFESLLSQPELLEDGKARFDHLCQHYGVNPEHCNERGWVRVERRIRRGSNKKYISPEMLLDPDAAFCDSFDGLTDLYHDYCAAVERDYADMRSFRRVTAEKLEVMDFSKRLYYARMHVGNLVNTLQGMDYSAGQIVEQLTGKVSAHDDIFDLLE